MKQGKEKYVNKMVKSFGYTECEAEEEWTWLEENSRQHEDEIERIRSSAWEKD